MDIASRNGWSHSAKAIVGELSLPCVSLSFHWVFAILDVFLGSHVPRLNLSF